MRRTLLILIPLLLTACTLLEVARQQKRAPEQSARESASMSTATVASADDPPAEKKFQNIQVLEGLPSSQLYPVMALFSNSLGVTCAHCHTEHFEEESKNEKQVARQMIRMTRAINEREFHGETAVTCYSCHRGQEYPNVTPLIEQAGWQKMISPAPPKGALPQLDPILARYSSAIGANPDSAAAPGWGEISLVGGLNERAKARFDLVRGTDGAVELETVLRVPAALPAALAKYGSGRLNLKERYDGTEVHRESTVDGRDAVIVMAISGDQPPERLAFERSTGLLLRVSTGTSTRLGFVPEEISFSDYQTVGGVPTPRTIQWGRGDFLVTLRYSE